MKLNDYLDHRLGVKFECKYNKLAIKEILTNAEKYPNVNKIISQKINMSNINRKANYNWDHFDLDFYDDYCADYHETIELYQAFVRALCKDIRNKDYEIKNFRYITYYLKEPNVEILMELGKEHYGNHYIYISNARKTIAKLVDYSEDITKFIQETLCFQKNAYSFKGNYNNILEQVKVELNYLIDNDALFANPFSEIDLKKNRLKITDDLYAYLIDSCEITIGENELYLMATENGVTQLETLKRIAFNSLTKKDKKIIEALEILKID